MARVIARVNATYMVADIGLYGILVVAGVTFAAERVSSVDLWKRAEQNGRSRSMPSGADKSLRSIRSFWWFESVKYGRFSIRIVSKESKSYHSMRYHIKCINLQESYCPFARVASS